MRELARGIGAALLVALATAPAASEPSAPAAGSSFAPALRGAVGAHDAPGLPGVRVGHDPLATGGARSAPLRATGASLRPIPYGDQLPPMRGALERSMVLGALRGAPGTDAAPTIEEPPTIDGAVRGALGHDEGLRASLARAEAARFAAHGALGAMLPKVELQAGYGTRDPLRDWEEATYRTARAVLTIPVFVSGSNINTMRAARASRDAAALAHLAEERRTVLAAATAHLDLHAALRVESALAENARGMRKTLTAARALYEGGEASLADVAVAEANLEAARGELAAARQALERARIDYRSRTGRPAPARPLPPRTDGLVPPTADEAVARALEGPEVAAGFRRADAARHAARAELGEAGPRIDLTASLGHEMDEIDAPEGEWDAAVSVRLTVPLVNFETIPGVRAARARARAAEYDARDQARETERAVRAAHANHGGALARQASAERRVDAMRRALDATRREYAAGFRTVTDVVRSQVGLARARIDLSTVERERHRAAFALAVATGWSPRGLRVAETKR